MPEQHALPEGFRLAACDAGIAKGERPDLMLAVADESCPAACLFTTNEIVASPVALCRAHLRESGGRVRAFLANAGCANACTGRAGDEDAARSAALVAEAIGCEVAEVLVFSTGVIGERLEVAKIEAALGGLVDGLARDASAIDAASRAILTTDTRPKVAARSLALPDGGEGRLLGIAKGSGMIHPDLATMLCFVFSDIEPGLDLPLVASLSARETWHHLTVDGDGSTNDSVLLWTSAKASAGEREERGFIEALDSLQLELVKEVARDGEGATKLVEVRVEGALTPIHALDCARTIAQSALVKTAVHGGDPNWGRILAAAGRSGADIDTRKARVGIGDTVLYEGDAPQPENEAAAAAQLARDEVLLWVDLASGQCETSCWTCDLSADYVRINADYRT